MDNIIYDSIIAGGSIYLFFLLLAALPTILCIVLFFKIWLMTNNVAEIKDLLKKEADKMHTMGDESVNT